MRKISGMLIFFGVVLIIGPFFGFTVRGAQDLDYGSGFILGIIFLSIGLFLNFCFNKK